MRKLKYSKDGVLVFICMPCLLPPSAASVFCASSHPVWPLSLCLGDSCPSGTHRTFLVAAFVGTQFQPSVVETNEHCKATASLLYS